MKVVKRDGRGVDYDRSKIVTAIKKANAEVEENERATDTQIESILTYIEGKNKKRMLVEDIRDIIEEKLMSFSFLLRLILYTAIKELWFVRQILPTILF